MESLTWRQDTAGLHIEIAANNKNAEFLINNSHINFLLAGTPRIYIVFVKLNDVEQEVSYLLDLENLRPVINKSNGLKKTIARKTTVSNYSGGEVVGRYCLARGESYHDRFLSSAGWQSQRVYSDIYLCGTAKNVVEPSTSTIDNVVSDNVVDISNTSNVDNYDDVDVDLTL